VHFFVDAAIGRVIRALLILKMGVKIMSNVTFGLLVIALFLAIFGAALIVGPAFMAGNVVLAILCACMFGMWAGVFIIERN
jgi:hypothetical protein